MFLTIFAKNYLFLSDENDQNNVSPPWEKVMVMLIIIQAFLNIMFFLKIFSEYGFLVKMVFKSIVDVGGFLSFFIMWLIFFSLQYANLNVEFGDDDGDYSSVPPWVVIVLNTFRTSIGDVQMAGYGKWEEERDLGDAEADPVKKYMASLMILLLWMFWFMNIALMCIILMNFLIAVISDSYA